MSAKDNIDPKKIKIEIPGKRRKELILFAKG